MASSRTSSHYSRHLLAGLVGAAGAWLLAIAPRSPFLRRLQNASLTPSSADHDAWPAVPAVPFAHRGLHDAGSGYPQTAGANGAGDAASSNVSNDAGGEDQLPKPVREYFMIARRLARRGGYGSGAPEGASIAPENTLPAFEAACRAGYGIELDLQMTADGQVVVFHDDDLLRAAGIRGRVQDFTYDQLCRVPLFSDAAGAGLAGHSVGADEAVGLDEARRTLEPWEQHIPLFSTVLDLVHGRVPLIVEYKAFGHRVPTELLEKGARLLQGYPGAYAVESFDPAAMGWYRRQFPRVLRGQLVEAEELADVVPQAPAALVRGVDGIGGGALADCVSRPDFLALDWHLAGSVGNRMGRRLGAQTVAWTVRSPQEALQCADRFDRMIFEGFIPDLGVFGSSDSARQ